VAIMLAACARDPIDGRRSNTAALEDGVRSPKEAADMREFAVNRRTMLKSCVAIAGALGIDTDLSTEVVAAAKPDRASGPLDARAEAKKIAFDRVGRGEEVLLISGFPQTRRSWNRLTPMLSQRYQAVPADLPSFGESGLLSAPATTENVGKVFHEFVVMNLHVPLHVVAHDFGAWCAFSWALQFPGDFKSLTLIEAAIPGVTLPADVELSDYKRKWNFIFQMLPDLPAELTKGKEDIYVGWWFKNKVYRPGAVPPEDVAAYARAYAQPGRMDAAFDYCRQILADIEFNKSHFKSKLPIRLLAVGGQYSIPAMGESLKPYFQDVTGVVIADSGHFVPEEQPAELHRVLSSFLA
jgi:pimeloyl-ACP methyl ester carboxylesterase